MSAKRRRARGARLEMTPLMDVMFLVLVFFIYCIFNMTVHRGVKVDLPQAAGEEEKGERIVITILPDDTLQFNGAPASRDEILAKISALAAVDAETRVILSGDRAASLGAGIELLSELKAAGLQKVSFQVGGSRKGE